MAEYIIKKGDSLSKIAPQFGVKWQEIYQANKGIIGANPNLIRPGQKLIIPDKAGTAPSVGGETPAGDISRTLPGEQQDTGGQLGNFRMALKSALNEAAGRRVANRAKQVMPLAGGVPGTMSSIVNMIKSGVKAPVESIFNDIMADFKSTKDFALNMSSRYPDAGILPTDTPETVSLKVSNAPSFASKAPEVIGSAEAGYMQWDPLNKDWMPIKSFPKNGVDVDRDFSYWIKEYDAGNIDIGDIRKAGIDEDKFLKAYWAPREWTESELNQKIRNANEKDVPFEQVIDELNTSIRIANKDFAKYITSKRYGIIEDTITFTQYMRETTSSFAPEGFSTGKKDEQQRSGQPLGKTPEEIEKAKKELKESFESKENLFELPDSITNFYK